MTKTQPFMPSPGGIRPASGERGAANERWRRAGVLSLLYIVSYLGLGVPAVIGGVLVTKVNGLLETAREYGSAVILLAVLALAGLLLRRPGKAPAATPVAVGCESSR
jgi:heme A synthase